MDESKATFDIVASPMPVTESEPALGNRRDAALRCLVERVAAGDEDALSRLYDETSPVVFALALRILRNRADAEEAVLDTYSRAWRKAASYDVTRSSVLTWLIIMARSVSIDRLRSGARRKISEPLEPAEEMTSPGWDPEVAAYYAQRRVRVLSCLARLPAEQREALELAFLGGCSHSELSAQLGVPLGTIKTRVRLGMARMRTLLGELA
jgi:RNA polymerase sigma-70 factor (ECF subfamily)